ncbi:MAG: di-trans,poly-cis-decaprenylcistransferase [Proteobacteria bacterium]|nr:di-trans,poly-cis-decaprenylcistransferase [Pseudomonadota bacterium]
MSPPADPRTPRHVAIVMDGNGRWARRRGQPRSFGHRAGQKAVREAVEFCLRRKIESLTLFAFSSENWKRPDEEVGALMELFLRALDKEVEELHSNEVRVHFVGGLSVFNEALRTRMHAAMEKTGGNRALDLNVCVNYGGRWDIAQAARKVAQAVQRGELPAESIDETSLAPFLCLAEQPAVDLLIRTGGEHRISNFLLWQIAYAELYFTDVLWPDVDQDELARALDNFAQRERRFGNAGAQIARAS